MAEPGVKNHPGLAAVLSFVFNGLGQLYNGQIAKGLLLMSASAIVLLIFILGSIAIGAWFLGKVASPQALRYGVAFFIAGLLGIIGLGIYSILDAYRTALKK